MRPLIMAAVLYTCCYTDTVAQQSARSLAVNVGDSRIFVVTHRSGILSFLGHEHAILANQWTATVCWDAPAHAASRAALSIDAATLTIDADSARQLAGLGGGPSAGQRAQIQIKMLNNLAVQEHNTLRFASDSIRTQAGQLVLFGRLTIKGRMHNIDMPITIRENGREVSISGHTTFRQSTFGISPESIARVVKVQDRVDLHVRLRGSVTTNACS
jgi:polyisoprenoid-binding protein YceI